MDFILIPVPKMVQFHEETFRLVEPMIIKIPNQSLFQVAKRLQQTIFQATKLMPHILIGTEGLVQFIKDVSLPEEGYTLTINHRGIIIRYHQNRGAFYAVSTLKQILLQAGKNLPCLEIVDEPDFKRRGLMLDISRDKIPSMETLFQIIDWMADLKYNELQLYIEGFSYGYESFPEVWRDQTPILPEEMITLDRYCQQYYIDFVPNQNSFGHMAPWLNRLEYADLAVCPEGCISPWGTWTKNTTLDPQDPRSIELVTKQYDDLLPYFTSEYFNVGMDEPIELGHGKSEAICQKLGLSRVYLDYLLKIYEEVKKRGKKMMFWGDIIIKSPELIHELPKDIIALEWGYEGDHPFNTRLPKYQAAGIEFYVCPGTSSWNSILGRTNNMKDNIIHAAVYGKEFGAKGFLLTDWGDNGHIQYLPISYPAFVLGAAVSWSVAENKAIDVIPYLNYFVFEDSSKRMGQCLWNVGNYYELESVQIANATKIFMSFKQSLTDQEKVSSFIKGLTVDDYLKVKAFLEEALEELEKTQMHCVDAPLIKGELKTGIQYVLHGAKRILYMLGYYEDEVAILYELRQEISVIMKNHYELWVKRNRLGGLESSLSDMRRQRDEYDQLLDQLLDQ